MPTRRAAITEIRIADPQERAQALAVFVADKIIAELKLHPTTSIALSGGRTPSRFFRELSEIELPWERVTVVLIDERWVPENSDRSNARSIRENLLKNQAKNAQFFELFDPFSERPELAVFALNQRFKASVPQPFCCAVLGMGLDGHTASWFPDGDHLEDAFHPNQQSIFLPMNAATAGEPRMTLSLPPLASSRAVALLIEGRDKWQVYEASKEIGSTLPFTQIILSAGRRLTVFGD
ncbi:MAG: 6-phosphogluconolactonase [Candidatus Pacebacteria bacterium]|nr:6-phosphogluconolactonase [Candidatus Paceibacterota bacterium]